ncbi:MAG: VIT1/CCC1 transporter family protein [Chloroflexota bacterium]|nr:VIT1/CCC1 transporter family protein [Chloroflexota bacterium]
MNGESKIGKQIKAQLLTYQQNEITEYQIYQRLAAIEKSPANRAVLQRIAADELRHARIWQQYTGQEAPPRRWLLWKYYLISRFLGLTFGLKLMERGEEGAQENYAELSRIVPVAEDIMREEHEHEQALLALLNEELLHYVSSIVLGLSDALVELTGALAGFTLALQNTQLIALTGSITGIAAAFSMGASEYLSTKAEEGVKTPLKAALYTGSAYIVTVLLLILPYLLLDNYFVCLGFTLLAALVIIAVFNYYISVAQEVSFRQHFFEMSGLSLGVAGLSFLVGFLVRTFLGVEI